MRARLPRRGDPQHRARHQRPAAHRGPPARHRRGAARGAGAISSIRLADAAREVYRATSRPPPFHEIVAQGGRGLDVESAVTRGHLRKLANALVAFPVAKTRPFFDAAEKRHSPDSGGLFSAAIDPWKCTGCLECVDVCGPHALVEREQDAALLDMLQARFEFLSRTPNTPARFVDGAVTDPTATPSA